MNAILQRFKSKTYWVAIVGALLTVIEANSGFIGQFLPTEYRAYIVMLWPVLMLVLREITTSALSNKQYMDTQQLVNIVLSLSMSIMGWFAKELWDAVKDLKSDLAKLREDLPKTYVVKDDYRQDMNDIKIMLGKIFDKLDNKQDK